MEFIRYLNYRPRVIGNRIGNKHVIQPVCFRGYTAAHRYLLCVFSIEALVIPNDHRRARHRRGSPVIYNL